MSPRSSLGYRVRHCLKGKKEKKPNNTNKKNNNVKEVTLLAMACDPAPPRPRPSPRPPAHGGRDSLVLIPTARPPQPFLRLPAAHEAEYMQYASVCGSSSAVGRPAGRRGRRGLRPVRGGLVLSVRGLRFSPSLSFLVLSFVVAFELCFCLVLTLLLNSPKLRQ